MARVSKKSSNKKTKQGSKTSAKTSSSAAAPAPSGEAIIVLGMHRSGSSALTRVLNLVGCDLPHHLMGQAESNKTGHWESQRISDLNDEILESAGSNWRDWQSFNPDWYATPRVAEYKSRAAEAIESEFGSSKLFVLKDPRMARLFPFWRDQLTQMGYNLRIVLTLRHPFEVMESLRKRDGMHELLALILWLRHVLDAEHTSRGLPRAVVPYRTVLQDPLSVIDDLKTKLDIYWPRMSQRVEQEIISYVQPNLRHHDFGETIGQGEIFADWLRDTYGILSKWAKDGEDSQDFAKLDALRNNIDDMSIPLRGAIDAMTKQYQKNGETQKTVNELNGLLKSKEDEIAAAKDQQLAIASDLETAQQDKHAAAAEVQELQKQIETLSAEQKELSAARDTLMADVSNLRKEAEEAASNWQAQVNDKEDQRSKAQAALNEANNRRQAIEAMIQQRDFDLSQVRTELQSKTQELQDLSAELKNALEENRVLKNNLEQRSHEAAETANTLGAANETLAELQSQIDDARTEFDALKSIHQTEITELKTQHEAQLSDRATEIENLREQQIALEAKTQGQQRDIRIRDQKILSLETQLGSRSKELAELARIVVQTEKVSADQLAAGAQAQEHLHKHISNLDQKLSQLESRKQHLEKQNAELAAEVQAQQAAQDALRASTSWRLTAPIRRLVDALRK